MPSLNEAQTRIINIIKASGKKGALVGQLSNEEKGTVHAPATESMAKKGYVVINSLENGVRRAVLGDLSALKKGAKAESEEKPSKKDKKAEKPAKAEKPSKSKSKKEDDDEDDDSDDDDSDDDDSDDDDSDDDDVEEAKAEPKKDKKAEKPAKAGKSGGDKPAATFTEKHKGSVLSILSVCRKAATTAGKDKAWFDAFVAETKGLDPAGVLKVVSKHFDVAFEETVPAESEEKPSKKDKKSKKGE